MTPAARTEATAATSPPAFDGEIAEMAGLLDLADQFNRRGGVMVQAAATRRREAHERAAAAIRRASVKKKEAGFWGKVLKTAKTVGTVAAIAGGVAAAGATGGTSLIAVAALASVALSTASLVMKETGNDVSLATIPVGKGGFDMKLSDAFTIGAVGLGGVGAVGAAAGAGASGAQAATVLTRAATVTAVASSAVQSGATGVAAYATLNAGKATAREAEHLADAKGEQAEAELAKTDVEDALALMRVAMGVRERAGQALRDYVETKQRALTALVQGVRA